MNFHWIDSTIVFGTAIFFAILAIVTKRYNRTTADFLAANRCAGRYLLTLADSVSGLGAVSVIAMFQLTYGSGFASGWWSNIMVPAAMIMMLSGWVVYRYRETRALTLAQFFEVRYSRKFRIFAGIVCWVSGLLNFGIFPAVGATFFITYCGLAEHYQFAGVVFQTYPTLVVIMVAVSLYFTFIGGQVTILITDFVQSFFCSVVLMAILVLVLIKFPLRDVFDGLLIAEPGKSMVNPFDAGRSEFSPWYFIISVFGMFINRMSWQGTQAFNCSAKSPHEARMAGVLATYRSWAFTYALVLLPLVAYMIMHHPAYAAQAEHVRNMASAIGNAEVRDQMLVPLTMTLYMPVGLIGAFVAIILAANVSTHNIYLHSWGSILVQDIIMPLRKKPFTEKQHMLALRLSILFVGIFISFFSCFFRQTQHIMYFFALTGAVWMGGIGAVIIGGLYTRWGTTAGAYVALIVGSILASGGMVCDQLWVSWYGKNFFLNGQEVYFYAMIISGMLYVAFSLIGKRIHFDLDKMLHRGQYRIESERLDSDTDTDEQSSVNAKLSFKKAFGISKDFTRGDKIIYGLTIYKSLILFIIFVVMTLVAFFWGLSDRQWSTYHYYMLWFWIGTSFIIAVWLLIGGILDARSLLKTLLASKHEVGDDGRVTLNCQENAAIDNVIESGSQKKS